MAEGRILRVQFDYNPNSSSMSGGSLPDLGGLLLFALGAVGGGAIAYAATRPAIRACEATSFGAGQFDRERQLGLSFQVERKRRFRDQSGEQELVTGVYYVRSGLELGELGRMVEQEGVRVTMIGPAIDAPEPEDK